MLSLFISPTSALPNPCYFTVGGASTQHPRSTMDEAVAMVAPSLWSVQVPKILRSLSSAHVPCSRRQISGGFNAALRVRHG